MRIGLGVESIKDSKGLGSSQRALLTGFRSTGSDHEITVFGSRADLETATLLLPTASPRVVDSETHLAETVNDEQIDVFHGLSYVIPQGLLCRSVVTTLDTMMLRNVDGLDISEGETRLILDCAERADHIITLSTFTKECIVSEMGIDEGKISVVFPGIMPEFFALTDAQLPEDTLSQLGISGRFILHVGGVMPRKNLKALLSAFMQVRTHYGHEVSLVIVNGTRDYGIHHRLREVLVDHPELRFGKMDGAIYRASNLVVTGPLDVVTLTSLYKSASVFCYPSLEEGFGLPPVEAMACGAVVVASNTSCLPEILEDGALLVDPLNHAELARTISLVLSDLDLAADLRKRGVVRAQQFTAEAMALGTIEAYRRALEDGSRPSDT